MEKVYYIYALVNPKTQAIFYIGTTSHVATTRKNYALRVAIENPHYISGPKVQYIAEMGCDPLLIVIDRIVCKANADFWGLPKKVLMAEKYWIEKMLDIGTDLKNVTWYRDEVALTG